MQSYLVSSSASKPYGAHMWLTLLVLLSSHPLFRLLDQNIPNELQLTQMSLRLSDYDHWIEFVFFTPMMKCEYTM